MSTVKFRKVPELFPNRKVRTVRTEQLWLEPAHRVSDYVRVGSGLGSKLFTYRPGIVTRLLTEQQNDTTRLTHERIVQRRGSMNTRPLNLKRSKLTLIASQLAPCVASVSV